MKNSRNIKTVDLIEALRRCSTPGVHCDGCVFCSDEDHEDPWCGDVLLQEAVRRLAEYTDRCARYAEEIAVLKAAFKSEAIADVVSLEEGRVMKKKMAKEMKVFVWMGVASVVIMLIYSFKYHLWGL